MGIYFALPTQLTSDKVYERMNDFLTNVLEKSDNGLNALLLHSAVWLRNTELGEDGSPGHSWFNSAKRGLLAPFAVGTIDQALMSVMNVKHGFVRTFGLAGKVVILDEVHSYDNYTGTILKELVAALRQLHCTVIILSATLTNKQRFALMGLNRDVYAQTRHSAYPLISAHIKNVFKETATKKINNVTVNVCLTHKDTDALEETLKRSERGEQVLWIENTVQDAQERYCQLAARSAEINVDCGLLHSRFIKTDRNRNEKKWVDVFGAMGRNIRQTKGRILVGTQVLEQSLDIDADFIVMRLCPTDMLFQRIGRLWRHRENDRIRSPQSRREAWILAPRLDNVISGEDSFGKSAKVYSPYILCRTLEVWNSLLIVGVPNDIRLLLEKTYADREESGVLAEFKRKTDEKRDNLHRFALSSISIGGITLPESKATTRYSEMESTEVLLIRKKVQQHNKVILKLLDGSEIELPKFANVVQRRNIASIILSNIVTVPEYLAPDVATKQLGWLKDYVYLGDGKENPFRVAIIADSGDLRGIYETKASINYDLNYDACLGYRATKKKGFCDGAGE